MNAAAALRGGLWHNLRADWDLFLLLGLILADVRIFNGSSVASFTLYELFVWGYCAPFVIGHLLNSRRVFSTVRASFMRSVIRYVAWILLAAVIALLARGDTDVLQQAKNVVPALPLAAYLLIRLNRAGTIERLTNFYLVYCLAACVVAVVQFRNGGPYFRPPIENNEYKLNFAGDVVGNVVLGFSGTPNELAVATLPGAMFSAMKLVAEVRTRGLPRLVTVACCLATAALLVLAESRGVLLWFVVAFVFVAGPAGRVGRFGLKASLVAVLIAFLVLYGLDRGAHGAAPVDETLEVRFLLWKTSLEAMLHDPYVAVFGDGSPYVQSRSWESAGWEFPDAHNGWLDQALFFGLPALLMYFFIWRGFFRVVDPAAREGLMPWQALHSLEAIRACVLAYMGIYFFEPVAHAVFAVSQLFFLMSCGVALSSMQAPPVPNLDRGFLSAFDDPDGSPSRRVARVAAMPDDRDGVMFASR